jgi:hypothetical protein
MLPLRDDLGFGLIDFTRKRRKETNERKSNFPFSIGPTHPGLKNL